MFCHIQFSLESSIPGKIRTAMNIVKIIIDAKDIFMYASPT